MLLKNTYIYNIDLAANLSNYFKNFSFLQYFKKCHTQTIK